MYKNLILEEILNPENLNKAYKRVYQNKGSAGVDGVTVEEIAEYIRDNKEKITILYSIAHGHLNCNRLAPLFF